MRKILAIDGGGIRGIIPLYFLWHLEQDLKKSKNLGTLGTLGTLGIYDIFDYFGGTSVGAILTVAGKFISVL